MSCHLVAFSGSLREDSLNRKLLLHAITAASDAGASVDHLDLRDFRAPIYDGDAETRSGMPESIQAFVDRVMKADGLLIASPEHNGSVTAALKNTIDWASRHREGRATCFTGKTVALLAATPGGHGALGGLEHLRAILGNLGAQVLEEHFGLPTAHEAFNDDSALLDDAHQAAARSVAQQLVEAVG